MRGVDDAYARAGVDTEQADRGVDALVAVLSSIDPGRSRLSVPLPGHYASVLRVGPNLGIALATDSVGSKVIVAEQLGRFDTIGVDCVAMNVNDLICVGAEPLALLDYVAVERADPGQLRELAEGLKTGAELAGIEIPGGEVCQLPEVIRGHPSPLGFDLVGSAFGTVALDAIVDGSRMAPGDAVIGLPASGVHANGLTLARRALVDEGGLTLHDVPEELGGFSVGETLLEPTVIYVRAVMDLLRSDVDGPRPGPHHRRRAVEPPAHRDRNRVRDHESAAGPPRVRVDRGARRGERGRDVGGVQHGLRVLRDGRGR